MKWIKYIGHPVLVMSFFLLLLIESEHFGGFYLLYILMALPEGAAFSLTAVSGLIFIFLGYKIYRRKSNPLKPMLYLLGNCIMILSLFLFFKRKDRLETFELTIPILTFIFFAASSFCFLINTFSLLKQTLRKDYNLKSTI